MLTFPGSAQEPRSTASLANDEAMLNAFREGKDLYAVIGTKVFHNDYYDNLEFGKDGKVQPDGKARRSKCKVVLLGITYGMSAKSLADSMDLPVEEAEQIISNFYEGFPGVKKLTDDSQKMLKEKGYVTDMWGRRRHIPDAQLPDYSIKPLKGGSFEFNPLIGAIQHEDKALQAKINQYEEKLKKCKWKKEKDAVIEQAKKDGFKITNNQGFINRALRQCLNARIQGTAASMTKQAMININNDKILNDLGFRLLITVHDEVFGECPTENSELASKRLSEVMVEAAKTKCNCPFKCDGYEVKRWYADECAASVKDKYQKELKSGKSDDDAMLSIINKFNFIKAEYVKQMCMGEYDPNAHEDI